MTQGNRDEDADFVIMGCTAIFKKTDIMLLNTIGRGAICYKPNTTSYLYITEQESKVSINSSTQENPCYSNLSSRKSKLAFTNFISKFVSCFVPHILDEGKSIHLVHEIPQNHH